ncbi:nickel-dependent hydrogenase large subunit [Bradyrhizobium iriomotense]|uniref:Hydrogenase expression/formation protein HupK n=1 Tax=Bradyrhizobium iriomotense TaxID=441950 RepID=A0ABQ6B7N2_9BRAD|nr:nickel-dependent hydrogenase large subunit [Bradyrhizobium iriomotense]GLR90073.1 hydrogenase expression/formation protein HupK [Bradyrhizobium iriomotense]
MSLGFRNEIGITVWLAGCSIADVAILPRSRPPVMRLFAGRPPSSVLPVLPRLFSLCAVAQQVAYLSAVEAARGEDAAAETVQRRVTAVVAERLTELVRGLFVGQLALDGTGTAAVRALMQAATVLGRVASKGARGGAMHEAVSQIRSALIALWNQPPEPGRAGAATPLASFDADALSFPAVEQSFLSVADDPDVVVRLLTEGASFSGAPELHGRIPETGVWARRSGREQSLPLDAGPAERLKARVAEVARLLAWLDDAERDPEVGVIASYSLGNRRGAAAVECARGRLYHAMELDDENRIVRFEFLAPTEWNFHARGPLVRSLKGSLLAAGQRGQDAVRTLVGSFDPCVGFSLNFHEAGCA